MDKTRILIADDHTMFCEGLSRLITTQPDLEVVEVARTGPEVVGKVIEHLPDVVLMDIEMPQLDGIEATRQIKNVKPDISVIMVTMHLSSDYLLNSVKAGASGYVMKDSSINELLDVIRAVRRGETVLNPLVARMILDGFRRPRVEGISGPQTAPSFTPLTHRETEILRLLATGYKNKDIADKLFLSVSTVKNYLTSIYEKLGVSTRVEAVKQALRQGILQPGEMLRDN